MSLSEANIDFLDGPGTAGFLTVGNPASGYFSSGVDNDAYRVQLCAGVHYGFVLLSPKHSADVELMSGSSTVVAESTEYNDPSIPMPFDVIEFTPSTSGAYWLSVDAHGGAGPYLIDYEIIEGTYDDYSADNETSPLIPLGGTPVSGRLEIMGDSDGFVVTLAAGQRYVVEYTGGVTDLRLQVQNGGYEDQPVSIAAGGGCASFVSRQTGGALLLLSSTSLAKTGSYTMVVTQAHSNTAHLVLGTWGDDRLAGTTGGDEMHGGWGADTLTGGGGGDFLFGGQAADRLDGGAGADRLDGGRGSDTYLVGNPADVVVEEAGAGIDQVIASLDWTLAANVENLVLAGGALRGTGNATNNLVTGNAGANVLRGGLGVDTLIGNQGADTLDGSGDFDGDSMVGGTGGDTYVVGHIYDRTVETSTLAGEIDTVRSTQSWTLGANLENLVLIGANRMTGTGNQLANQLTANVGGSELEGEGGNDTLQGAAGLDELYGGTGADLLRGGGGFDRLYGGPGVDTLDGGNGGDAYYVDTATEVVRDTGTDADATDVVWATLSYTAPDAIETVMLTGTGNFTGIGNALDNWLGGNNGDNVLRGLSGDDRLEGQAGADTLVGGPGNDTLTGAGDGERTVFRFDAPLSETNNVDLILGFGYAGTDDRLSLSLAVFDALPGPGALADSAFRVGPAALDASDRIAYDQSTGRVFYDADGSGPGGALLFVVLDAHETLTAGDFWGS